MGQLVLLLRGINVGRAKRIAMADLRAMLDGMGYDGVRTQGQSGNAIVAADDPPATVAAAVEEAIRARFGIEVDVHVRTSEELAAVLAANPLEGVATDGAKHVVAFLGAEPDAAAVRALEEEEFAPEELRARGREVYAWCPGGLNKSPLHAALGERLAPSASSVTVRNWNTLAKLHAMLDAH